MLLSFFSEIVAQSLRLEIKSLKAAEQIFLKNIALKTKHSDSISLDKELKRIHSFLKTNGYFLNSLDSITRQEKKYTAFFKLDAKVDSAVLYFDALTLPILKASKFKNKLLRIPINVLEITLQEILNTQEVIGSAFSKIKLNKVRIKDNLLLAEIQLISAQKRKIDKLIFKGYPLFPKSFIKNYFQIQNTSIFNKKKLNQISKLSQYLTFASEIKPPETLFTKDSTFVYVYLRKDKGSSFDGLVNFTSQENGKIQLNGHLDLNLNNSLNSGERLKLLWNRLGNEKQEFNLSAKIPYFLNSKVSPMLAFSIYKQDSTFLNTNFKTQLRYQLKANNSLFASFSSENSKELISTQINSIETFKSTFFGFGYEYAFPKNDNFQNNKFLINVHPSFGKRRNNKKSYHQLKLETALSYIVELNNRNSLSLKNSVGILNSENYIDNELFRIGGSNSIRGFNEQSIFAKNFILQNIEYRYRTAADAYLYTIADFALVNTQLKKEKFIGIGFGYLFTTNKTQINISTAVGTNSSAPINLKNAQLLINWINFF
jgi:hypothetical protein